MLPSNPVFRIMKDDGMGSFLCPPGHPSYEYSVHVYYPRGNRTVRVTSRREADDFLSIEAALGGQDNIPENLREQLQRLIDSAPVVCSELWVRHVYGYFRNCYAPAPEYRNVSEALVYSPESGDQRPPSDHHLGYLRVKHYFPAHTPREDLIANPGRGYGSWPCDKCGQRVQYEARKDAWCHVFPADADCPQGGQHEVALYPVKEDHRGT